MTKFSALKSAALAATIALTGCAEVSVNKLRNTVPQGSAFTKALASEYLRFAESEYKIHNDDWDAHKFAQKGLRAAAGQEIMPEDPAKYDLPLDSVNEIMHSRNRLLHALNSGGKAQYPVESAKAQVMFDCWVEQREENFQYDHVAACRDGFYKHVRMVELSLDRKSEAFDASLGHRPVHKIFFKLGSSRLSKDDLVVVRDVAQLYRKFLAQDKDVRIFVYGYTDMSGTKSLNQRLSKKRAARVRSALIRAGVDGKAIDNEGKGRLEGAKVDQQHRKVDITIDVK